MHRNAHAKSMDARPHQNVPAYGIRFAIASGMNETFETTLLASMRDYRGHAVSYCERPTLIGSGAEAKIFSFVSRPLRDILLSPWSRAASNPNASSSSCRGNSLRIGRSNAWDTRRRVFSPAETTPLAAESVFSS